MPLKKGLTFKTLVSSIEGAHQQCLLQAAKAVNIGLTLRNWAIGCYIEQYERAGVDRARYGERLMESLAETLTAHGISGCDRRELYRHRRFYLGYPQIVEALSPQLVISKEIVVAMKKVGTLSPQLGVPGKDLVERFSYSHFSEFLGIDDPLKRVFYEQECLRGNWSVRELQRQIATLYFERSGLSRNKKKLAALTHKKAEIGKPDFVVRDPVVHTQESRDGRICTGGNG